MNNTIMLSHLAKSSISTFFRLSALLLCALVLVAGPVAAQETDSAASAINPEYLLPQRLPGSIRTRGDLVDYAASLMGGTLVKDPDAVLDRLLGETLPTGSSGIAGRTALEAIHLVLGDIAFVSISEDEGQIRISRFSPDPDSAALAYVRSKSENAPMSPTVIGGFTVEPGSLRTRVRQLVAAYGWSLVGWDENLRNNGHILDWRIHAPFVISAPRLSDALELLLKPYGLQAVMYTQDRTVVVRIVTSSRITSPTN